MDITKKLTQDNWVSKYDGAVTALDALINNSSYQAIKSIAENSAISALAGVELSSLHKELQKSRELWSSQYKGYASALSSIKPVLDSYNRVSELTCITKDVASLLQPLSDARLVLQSIKLPADTFSHFKELSTLVLDNPSLLTHLQSAVESQIDTSIWDYWDYTQRSPEETIDSSMEDEIVEIVKSDDKKSSVKHFFARYGEPGIKLLARFICFLIITFCSGLVTTYCEPIYKILIPSTLWQDENMEHSQVETIPTDTKIHIWGDLEENLIQISYTVDNKEYQGYISKFELENNSQKISNAVEWEHVVFINEVVELLADEWNLDCEIVYNFLKDDTSIMNDYILEHYDVLCYIDKGELVNVIEQYCKEKRISIPKVEE